MTAETLLAVCIPTYQRAKDLIGNLENMDFRDPRVQFVVSSNGIDGELADYCSARLDILYRQSKVNQGFTSNFFKSLELSGARFSLVISDEDYLNQINFNALISHLEKCHDDSRQFLIPTHDYFSLGSMRRLIGKQKLSYLDIMLTNPFIPTYLSGYVFPSKTLVAKVSHSSSNPLNAYPFIILRNKLLKEKVTLQILSGVTITRGPNSSNRDMELNYVDISVGIARTNYFLSHYKDIHRHNWLIEFWVASLVLAQTQSGYPSGYFSLNLLVDCDARYIGIQLLGNPNFQSRFFKRVSEVILFCSHIYRRILIH